MIDRHYRSVMKAVSWRMVGTFDTMIVSYFISGELMIAISIGFVELFTKMVLYYFHERAWNRIGLGREGRLPDLEVGAQCFATAWWSFFAISPFAVNKLSINS